jgi:hypothetical protein
MLAAFIDHLWQSSVFTAMVAGLVLATRRNSAALQFWLWRVAALKFVLPFGALFALGGWIGFPVRHSASPPPTPLVDMVSRGLSIAAPVTTSELGAVATALALLAALSVTAVCGRMIHLGLRRARQLRDAQHARSVADWHDQPPPLGFWQSALLAGFALLAFSLPVIAGATRDRQWRQYVLAIDQEALRSAGIVIAEAPAGAGILERVEATDHGVSIHNINLQDLVSLVYGIGKFEVFGGAMPWLEYPRYDVQVTGPLRAPEVFDPYALREPMTNYLYQQFGVSIRVNGTCQKPCKDYESFVIERLPRCTRLLSAHPGCN